MDVPALLLGLHPCSTQHLAPKHHASPDPCDSCPQATPPAWAHCWCGQRLSLCCGRCSGGECGCLFLAFPSVASLLRNLPEHCMCQLYARLFRLQVIHTGMINKTEEQGFGAEGVRASDDLAHNAKHVSARCCCHSSRMGWHIPTELCRTTP